MVADTSNMPKVAIVLPSGDQVTKGFAMSLAGLVMNVSLATEDGEPPVPVVLVPIEGAHIERNRNVGVSLALEFGADYVLQIDSDQVFPPGILRQLLRGAMSGCDIVGATCARRGPPFTPVGNWTADQSITKAHVQAALSSGKLHAVAALGTGCILVSRRVFEAMPGPFWFRSDIDHARPLPAGLTTAQRHDAMFVSEDFGFCARARAAGFTVWLDAAASSDLGHVGRQVNYIDGTRWDAMPAHASPNWHTPAA